MMEWCWFIIGWFVGASCAVVVLCVIQWSRQSREEEARDAAVMEAARWHRECEGVPHE